MQCVQVLTSQPTIGIADSPVPSAAAGAFGITVTDVHFQYPTRPDTPVLRGLTLRVEPNKVSPSLNVAAF
jgi:hypothetical protein